MAKKKNIKNAYTKLQNLKQVFENEDTSHSKLALSLIDEAFFCGKTLEKLKKKVEEDGVITEMCQGDYSIQRENPALKSYNTTIKNFQALLKQISELLPIEIENKNKNDEEDDFEEFNEEL